MAEVEEKAVQVPTDPYASYNVGDDVRIVLKATMGIKAVWLSYFLPLLVLLAVALGLIWAGVGELFSGLAGIGAVGLYYFVLWLLREKFRSEYVFTIQSL